MNNHNPDFNQFFPDCIQRNDEKSIFKKTNICTLSWVLKIAFMFVGYCFIYTTKNNPNMKRHAHKHQEVFRELPVYHRNCS